jgi:hypothetical protein
MSGFAYMSKITSGEDSERCRRLAITALDCWVNHLNSNGSANEWYRNEQSFCATAMGLHSAAETLFVLKDEYPVEETRRRTDTLRRSALWLTRRDNDLATNQQVASIAGRYILGILANDPEMSSRAIRDTSRVEAMFERVGYLPEYEGMDIGYTLLSLDLLAAAHRAGLSECEPLVSGVCTQLSRLAGGSSELPFELGSRGTSHKFFGGVLYFSKIVKSAQEFVETNRDLVSMSQFHDVSRYDDRYLATFGFSALARRVAFETLKNQVSRYLFTGSLRFPIPPIMSHPFAGGMLFQNSTLGGAISWQRVGVTPLVQLGYVFSDDSGKRWTSLGQSDASPKTYGFVRMSEVMPLIRYEWASRAIFALCRIPLIAALVSRLARTRAGRPTQNISVTLKRLVNVSGEEVMVEDDVTISASVRGVLTPMMSFPFHSPSLMSTLRAHAHDSEFVRVISEQTTKASVGDSGAPSELKVSVRWKLVSGSSQEVSLHVV